MKQQKLSKYKYTYKHIRQDSYILTIWADNKKDATKTLKKYNLTHKFNFIERIKSKFVKLK